MTEFVSNRGFSDVSARIGIDETGSSITPKSGVHTKQLRL